ncbi:hypothetical protein M9435_001518 [Picochlorum sp. BPE23]|nr:hypothetical protein M9435_001518 [Picochlorum sp. BPE23]
MEEHDKEEGMETGVGQAKWNQSPLVCHGHSRPIVGLHFSPVTPDGVFLASASKDGQPQLRQGETGDWIGTFQGHKGAVWSCVLNDSAFVAATGSADFSARVWNAVTGDVVHEFPHKHIVRTTAFERGLTAKRLMTGGAEKMVRLYDLEKPEAEPFTFGPAPDSIRKCMWSLDNRRVLLSYLDTPGIDVIDLSSQTVVKRLLHGDGDGSSAVLDMVHTPCGRFMVTAEAHAVTIRHADSLEVLQRFSIDDYEVESADYCPERNVFVAGGSDMWTHMYDAGSGALLDHGRGHHGPVHCVRFSPKRDAFVSGSEDGTIRIWNMGSL